MIDFLKYWGRGVVLLIALVSCQASEEEEITSPPNILFAIADDASFPHMGAYGTSWVSTPAFDRVAQEGLLFMRAYTPNAKCAPSRACILTGRNSWQLEEAANHSPYFPGKFITFMETLKEQGYQTGYTAKGWAPGDPGEVDGKRRELTGTAYNQHSLEAPTAEINPTIMPRTLRIFSVRSPKINPFVSGTAQPNPIVPIRFVPVLSRVAKARVI